MTTLRRVGAARRGNGQVLGNREIGEDLVALRHQHDAMRRIGVRALIFDSLPAEADITGDDARIVEADEAGNRA